MTTLMLLSDDLSFLYGPIDNFTSLVWCEKYTECGSFTLMLPMSRELFAVLQSSAYLSVSGRPGLGRVERIRFSADASGTNGVGTLTVSGRMAVSLLSDRMILRGTRAKGELVSCVETVVKENACADAGERALPYLTIGAGEALLDSSGTEYTVDDAPGGQALDEWVRSVLSEVGAAYRILPDYAAGQLVFSVYRGLDRTPSQNVNGCAVFSSSFASVGEMEFVSDKSDYKNFAFIAGEGEGDARIIETLDLRAAGEPLRELYVDARDLRSDDGETVLDEASYRKLLLARGRQRLSEHNHVLTLEGSAAVYAAGETAAEEMLSADTLPPIGAVLGPSMRAGVDYALGDLCGIASDALGAVWEERITEITYTYEGTRCIVAPRFGVSYPDLRTLLKRREE